MEKKKKINFITRFIETFKKKLDDDKFKNMFKLIHYFEKKGLVNFTKMKGEIVGYSISNENPQSLNIFIKVDEKELAELIVQFSGNNPINTMYLMQDMKGDTINNVGRQQYLN
jgi:hypothetical protein